MSRSAPPGNRLLFCAGRGVWAPASGPKEAGVEGWPTQALSSPDLGLASRGFPSSPPSVRSFPLCLGVAKGSRGE